MYEIEMMGFSYADTPVLSLRSLRINPGEIVAIQGDNGTGKTTLLKLLAGIILAHSGRLSYQGINEVKERTAKLRAGAVFVHQNPYLFSGTVYHNIASAIGRKGSRSAVGKCVSDNLDLVGLNGFERRRARKLSAGEIKRVALARAMAAKPEVLILDEPTASVDSGTSERIVELLRILSAEKRTVIFSTHNHDIAYRVANRLLILRNGDIAPASLNIYRGIITNADDSFLYFSAGRYEIKCPIRDGSYTSAVLPYDDVILSEEKVATSAQNQVPGRVSQIREIDGRYRICLDCGVKIYSHITKRSLAEMRIDIGKKLYAVFKASSVQLY